MSYLKIFNPEATDVETPKAQLASLKKMLEGVIDARNDNKLILAVDPETQLTCVMSSIEESTAIRIKIEEDGRFSILHPDTSINETEWYATKANSNLDFETAASILRHEVAFTCNEDNMFGVDQAGHDQTVFFNHQDAMKQSLVEHLRLTA